MTIPNLIKAAARGLASNKLRALLTTLGIIIGTASVIAMLALGNGARAAVEASFRSLGSDQVSIAAREVLNDGEFIPIGKPLTYEDGLGLPITVDLVRRVDMTIYGSGRIRQGRVALDINFSGVTADLLENFVAQAELQPIDWLEEKPLDTSAFIARGRFFTLEEVSGDAQVCVLGFKTALDLFSGDDPLDAKVWVNRSSCQVIGVLSELVSNQVETYFTRDPNEAFYLPISTAAHILYEDEPSISITAFVTDERHMDSAKEAIAAYLRQRHDIQPDHEEQYQDDFVMTTRKDVLGSQQEAARTFSLLLAAMAVISLVVGGIGIMNVMLVGVSERTREIGVRMAIGARPVDIVGQFLLEAALISGVGGLLGIALGVLSIPIAASLNKGMALLDPISVPLSLGVGMLTGTIFGLYPAIRAARLDPIEALRHE